MNSHKSSSPCLQAIVLVGLVILMVIPSTVTPAAAMSATPAYVLGVLAPSDPLVAKLQTLTSSVTILPTVSVLSLVSGNSILFVDGSWLGSVSSLDPAVLSILVDKVLQGVPTVAVRGDPSVLVDAIPGLIKWRVPNVLSIAEGVKISGALPDGTRQGATLQVISGFDYAVERQFGWAEQHTTQAGLSGGSTSSQGSRLNSGPASIQHAETTSPWQFVIEGSIDTGDYFSPVGRVTSTVTVHLLMDDQSTTYKWFNFFHNQTVEPGIKIYDSKFRTSVELDRVRSQNSTTNILVDYGPRGLRQEGPDEISYTIGIVNGTLGANTTASQSANYFLKHTTVTDVTTIGESGDVIEAAWIHDIDSRSDSGKLTFQILPGWTVRVLQNEPVDISGRFQSSFDRYIANVVDTETVTVTVSAFGG